MITTISQLTELTTALQLIIAQVAQDSKLEVDMIGYYLETNNLTGSELPQITHRHLEQFQNEMGTDFQLSHLRIVNRLIDGDVQKVLTSYIDHQEQINLSSSINAENTKNFEYPDERVAYTRQLEALITNAFEK